MEEMGDVTALTDLLNRSDISELLNVEAMNHTDLSNTTDPMAPAKEFL